MVCNVRDKLLQQGPPLHQRVRYAISAQTVRRHTTGEVAAARQHLHFCQNLHQQMC